MLVVIWKRVCTILSLSLPREKEREIKGKITTRDIYRLRVMLKFVCMRDASLLKDDYLSMYILFNFKNEYVI